MKKLTTDEFIKKSNEKHGEGTYDYSKSEYKGCFDKICIICPKEGHGEFWQQPSNHLFGQGCPKCAIEKNHKQQTLKIENFIEKSNEIHGIGTYNYSNSIYINNRTKLCIICSKHGEFWQTPAHHLRGEGCPECAKERRADSKRLSYEEFVNKSNEIHNYFYDYSKSIYVNNSTPIEIICPIHGSFWQKPSDHMNNGSGCPKCADEHRGEYHKLTTETFIEKANEKKGMGTYDYSKVNYINSHTKIIIICPKHGEFLQTPNSHLHGYGCPKCQSSKGENLIRSYFLKNNIKFEEQKTFDGCVNKRNLKFDFYIKSLNLCIEYDGLYHFNNFSIWNISLSEKEKLEIYNNTHIRDLIKNKYCRDNNINLIRIKYSDDLFEILNKIVDCYNKNEYNKSLNYMEE